MAQTFTDFEVIVVDDCSTDNSAAIVESYIPKFDGRLKLYHMDSNTGSGAMPRNKGMMLSRGEYIAFVDNDDMITKTALEELYTLAKEYDAEVVYCEKHYKINSDGTGIHIGTGADQNVTLVDKPTFETNNLAERVQKILQGKYRVPQWRKFVRRSLIFEYELFFPGTRHADDVIWTYGLVLLCKAFLRVPNVTYIYRQSKNSIMRKKKTPQESINFWLNPSLIAMKKLDAFLVKASVTPQYRYAISANVIQSHFSSIFQDSLHLPPFAVYETIKQEFGDKLGEQDVLVAALCTLVNTQQKMFVVNQQRFNQFAAQAQKRIAELEAQLKTK